MKSCVFGPYRYLPPQGIIRNDGTLLRLGSRVREILAALLEQAGEVVSKRELMRRVWPESIVEEGTHQTLVAQGGLYARLAKLQFQGI